MREEREAGQYLEHKIQFWRKRISDSIFLFLAVFGFIAYIPSVLLSLKDHLYYVAVLDTATYVIIAALAFLKRIPYTVKAVIGSALIYHLGIALLLLLGPTGAGNLWLFAFSLIAGLTLGQRASLISLAINIITQILLYILLRSGILPDHGLRVMGSDVWLIRGVNFIILNVIIVISNNIFMSGFIQMLSQSEETRRATIMGLAKLAEYRDRDTGDHLRRIFSYTKLLTGRLALREEFRGYITRDYREDIALSSILHDIGKVGIHDAILLKNGPLTPEEFGIMKNHPLFGAAVIGEIEKNINGRSLYVLGKEIAGHHHERWDGTGYPDGLAGRDIPLSARIVALVDVYDALISERPYKRAMSHDEAREIIIAERGKQFDPLIVDVFLEIEEEFRRVSGGE